MTSGQGPGTGVGQQLGAVGQANSLSGAPGGPVGVGQGYGTQPGTSGQTLGGYTGVGVGGSFSPGRGGEHVNYFKPVPRAVTFSNLINTVADEAELYRYYDGEWRFLASLAQDDTFVDAVHDISEAEVLDTTAHSAFNGVYQYIYTFYNMEDGTESSPSPLSDELVARSGKINVSLPSVSEDPQVTHKRIYRIGGHRTLFALVAQVDADVVEYVDGLKDTDMDGRLLESNKYGKAPDDLQYITESYAMLFGAVGNTVQFTPVGKPNAWPPEYALQFNAPVTGVGPVANGVLVFTEFQTFIITGTGPLSLAQQPLRGDQGCIAAASIREVQNGALIWASADGLCMSSGNQVTNVTKPALGEVKLDPISSAVVDEVYYCHNADGSTLVWDYRFAPIFKYLDLGMETLTAAKSQMYGWLDGELQLLFSSEETLTFSYASPRFVEGSMTAPKTYKKVYVSSDGDIIINILIDDVVVATKALSGKDTTQLQVPTHKQRGFYVQFEITGTGKVLEVEYEVGVNK